MDGYAARRLARQLRWAALALLVLMVGAAILLARAPAPSWKRDSAYLWQRQWTEAVQAAARRPVPLGELRVLALEVDARGQSTRPAVRLDVLRRSGVRVVPVIRLDGRRPPLPAPELRRALQTLRSDWQAAGLIVAEIELDHDCARSGLMEYRDWIAQLRTDWPQPPRMVITGLPDWLESPDLPALLAAVDGYTLQVHAVDRPEAGLLDPERAKHWVAQLDALTRHEFHVALPTYAARIQGRLYWADPEVVAGLLAHWTRNPPQHLRGVRFFRLPVAGDPSVWAMPTLAALVQSRPLPDSALEVLQHARTMGGYDLELRNPGPADAVLPERIRVSGSCSAGDAALGYRFERQAEHVVFERTEADRLGPERRRTLGWIRCTAPVEIRLENPR